MAREQVTDTSVAAIAPALRALRASVRPPVWAPLVPASVALVVLYAWPLLRLVADSVLVDGRVSLERYVALWDSGQFPLIVWRTVLISAVVTAICVVLGYPLAYTIQRLRTGLAVPILLLVSIPFFTSTLIRSYAWVAMLADNGVVNGLLISTGVLTQPIRLVHNELGVLIGMVQVQLPLFVLPLYGVMRRVDRSLVLAAWICGASRAAAFWHVFRPLSLPGVAAGMSLVFITSLGFYVTPALLGGPGDYFVAQSIDVRVFWLNDFGAAAAQATVLLVIVVASIAALRRPLGLTLDEELGARAVSVPSREQKRSRRGSAVRATAALLSSWTAAITEAAASRARVPALALASIVALLFLVLPMAVVVLLAFSDGSYLSFPPPGYSLRWFASYIADPAWRDSTLFSLAVSAAAAALATALGTAASFPLVRAHMRAGGLMHLFFVAPLVIPYVVVGVAVFFVLAPHDLTGTPVAFVGTYAVLGLPYVVIIMSAVLKRFDRALEQAAASLGASTFQIAARITLPLVMPGLLTSFVFAFLVAFDDVVVALFLSGPGAVPLSIRMWEDLRFEITPRIAAVSVLLLAVTTALVIAATLRQRRSPAVDAAPIGLRSVT